MDSQISWTRVRWEAMAFQKECYMHCVLGIRAGHQIRKAVYRGKDWSYLGGSGS
ncbi:MAG: hypothetical protein P8I27_11920 [Pirellulaceae bacterium]|nr:hypothetical protein [Pirellulaceae bacterium]